MTLTILAVLVGLQFCAGQLKPDEQDADPAAQLAQKVERYFGCADPAKRREIERQIEQIAAGDPQVVAEAVRQARLWSALGSGEGRFSLTLPSKRTIDVQYVVPDGYDPAAAHPLLVCLGSQNSSPAEVLERAEVVLGRPARLMVRVAPSRAVGGSFWMPPAESGDFPALLQALRRRFHVDTNRVYLFGSHVGADAAWHLAIAHPDLIAGVVALSGFPHMPYAEQVYPFLLADLRTVAVLSVWWLGDMATLSNRAMFVKAHNQAIVRLADMMSWPIVGVEVGDESEAASVIAEKAEATVFAHERPPPGSEVSHWFRYPGQGRCGWLRQARFQQPVWESTQLAILPGPATDADAFIAKVIKSKLAFLHGTISGQQINIDAQRCERIELLLTDGLIDFDQPISLICNGKKRYQGRVQKKISTMLQTAYQNWDFQRLVWAKLSFRIDSVARQQ